MFLRRYGIVIVIAGVLYACDRDEDPIFVDEAKLLGRWESFSKTVVYQDGTQAETNEHICEWHDSYTFKENGTLLYFDGVRVSETECGDNPNIDPKGTWEQDLQGKFKFRISNSTENSTMILSPRKVYLVQNDEFLVIEYAGVDSDTVYYTSTSFAKVD